MLSFRTHTILVRDTVIHTLLTIVFLCVSFFPHTTHALESFVSIRVSPAYPSVGEQVSITLSSYSVDLPGASILWYVNGSQRASGIGMTSLSLPAGQAGKTTSIRAVISANGETIQKTISFVPGGVDLIWEATDSYTPPLYKGKALPASSALVHVVAIPNIVGSSGKTVAPENLVYTWTLNGFKRDVTSQSGYGKQTLSLMKNVLLSTESVGVEISSRDGSLGAGATVSIPQTDPEILFYEQRPLQGPWYGRALIDTVTLLSNELSLIAEPYYFSTKTGTPHNLGFAWSMNGSSISSDWNNPHMIIFGVPEGTSGKATVSLATTNPSKLLQDAKTSLSVIFGNTESSSWFK
ncbi:MAG: hypothetical protein HGB03_03820 [Candidatus Yonathbacteria bacterium]|nr:hypothetical protein [Candidatus Yonathbacteria bacterium]NTW47641.1 hypothetical protein [Candidatus Yonathbacteria bacterium]